MGTASADATAKSDPERLTPRDWFRLAGPTAGRALQLLAGSAMYLLGKRGETAAGLSELEPERTPWVDAALATAKEELSEGFLRHSQRSWLYASALSRADGRQVDPELLYVVCLLHDVGLLRPQSGRCFTAAGAEAARSTAVTAGVSLDRGEEAARAISDHISARNPDDLLTRYLQQGALLDVIGYRIQVVDPDVLAAASCRWSRAGFPQEARAAWKQESRRFRRGRANYARIWGFTLATRTSPLP